MASKNDKTVAVVYPEVEAGSECPCCHRMVPRGNKPLTEEEKAKRREQQRAYRAKRIESMTEEQKAAKREKQREYNERRRAEIRAALELARSIEAQSDAQAQTEGGEA
jgi:uncharacterized protein with WD repeat